jgi:hypothetical protein
MTHLTIKSVFALWNLVEENLKNSLSELRKPLEEIVLTTLVSTAESDRCCITLNRVKTHFMNSMGQECQCSAVLNIHKEVTANTSRFRQKVSQKNRKGQFLYV